MMGLRMAIAAAALAAAGGGSEPLFASPIKPRRRETYTPASDRGVSRTGRLTYELSETDKSRFLAAERRRELKSQKRALNAARSAFGYHPVHQANARA